MLIIDRNINVSAFERLDHSFEIVLLHDKEILIFDVPHNSIDMCEYYF